MLLCNWVAKKRDPFVCERLDELCVSLLGRGEKIVPNSAGTLCIDHLEGLLVTASKRKINTSTEMPFWVTGH